MTLDASGPAVVGDGSGLPDGAGDPGRVLRALQADARLLRDHTSLRPFPVAVSARDAGELGAALRGLPAATSIFVARTEAARAREVQRVLAHEGGVPVITEQDTQAIALTAEVLVRLRRARIAPFDARVVVAGPPVVPLLPALLTVAGIGDVTSWNRDDAHGFPLSSVTREADVVVDLLGLAPAPGEAGYQLVAPGDPAAALLALPGLLSAVHERAAAGKLSGHPMAHIEVHRACAQALARLTPVDRVLPEIADPDLTRRVADAAGEALGPRRR
ncbi:hypothetical protein DMP23_21145 [Amycolatopsis sp. A1MSW2902]|uniref:hypothetical protein n=1 Tax=Amycolatopsis sp. A1MSW2902 TaxID=687413 RepID=UPI00307F1BB9